MTGALPRYAAPCGPLPFFLALIGVCCACLAPGTTLAEGQPKGTPFELELTLNQLLGEQEAARYQEIIPPTKRLTWGAYLPDNDSTEPPGVFVYVSPRNRGRIDNRWRAAMDRHNLIYIGANDSGNRMPVTKRMVLALMALKALERDYLVNSRRITISGFSGGGRVASMLATQYPEVFTGAVYICGVNFWSEELNPRVDQIVQNRFVFLTGSNDFNLSETRIIHGRYLSAGAQYSKLMVSPGKAHELPDAGDMAEALDFIYGTGGDKAY